MLGHLRPRCLISGCNCYQAHDSRGRKDERRKVKRKERQAWKRQANNDKIVP